uniref:Uncharacterized protein n=1 Tax=Anopheles stephensi TaxID=30069 RepID=A0A182YLT7_ANOST
MQDLEAMEDQEGLETKEDKVVLEWEVHSEVQGLELMDARWLPVIRVHNSVLEQVELEAITVQDLELMDARWLPAIQARSMVLELPVIKQRNSVLGPKPEAHSVQALEEGSSELEQVDLQVPSVQVSAEMGAHLLFGAGARGTFGGSDGRSFGFGNQAQDSVEEQRLVLLEVKARHVIPSLEAHREDGTDEPNTTINADDSEQTTTFGGYGDVQSAGAGLYTNGNRRLVQ